ncbi:tetratricopeptide repeat-containing sensor histidine kinase [Oleiharenicola lentus]|uniref:ATP-binding protein n=1 Tax=Oleiharenicola lentus TaxID=2508720 RepID=UPI003F6770E4
MHRRFGFPLILVALGFFATTGWTQSNPPRPARDPGPPLSTASDSDLPDGEETWENARQILAKATNEPDALKALVTVVNLQRRRGDYADGLKGARDGLTRARALGDVRLQVDFLYLLGRLYWNLSDYPASLENHLEELKLAQRWDDASLLARTHGGLGLTYYRYGRMEDAFHHLNLGLELAAKASDDRMRASLLNSLGNCYLTEGKYERATALHEEALKIREGYGNHRAIAESLTNLGLVADANRDYPKALDYLQRALTTFEALKYRRYIANTHRRLGMVLRHAGRTDEALTHLQTALQIAKTLESAEVVADIQQELALTHEARKDLAAALESQRQLAAVTEQTRREEDRRRMDELRARYREEQRELEITLLKRDQELQTAELQRRRSQNWALAAGLIGGVILLGAVIVVQLVRQRADRKTLAATERARVQAEAAERLKSRLLQMASHDLKVPLSALNATAELIGRSPHEAVVVRRLAAGIQADTERMRSLVRDFLDASAIEDGNLQLHPAEMNLPDVARLAVETLQPVAAAKKQTLTLAESAVALPKVQADAERLRQVFDNLIGNALKFTPPGGVISVVPGEASGWVFVEVRDSGPGLGPADFAKIFAPFQRLSAKPTGEGEDSTGLGLFIARELLTLQGGRLEVQSQPGSGAVFRVLLPAAVVIEIG